MNLLAVEVRRAMHRRVVRVMILIALVACVVAGVIAFTSSAGKTVAQLHVRNNLHPAVLHDWWIAERADGVVLIAGVSLLMGGMFTGAAVAGAEWRAGTITTVLAWEPRRVRLNLTRTAAGAIVAFAVALALQVAFLVSFLPAVLVNGTTAGLDPDWWLSLAAVVVRIAMLTSLAATLAIALATLGRNTAFALAVVFSWMAVIENLVRALRPGWAGYLWGENLGTIIPWRQMEDVKFVRSPTLALGTVVVYTAALLIAATVAFARRDVAGTS